MSLRLGGRGVMSLFLALLLMVGSLGSVFAQATPEAGSEGGPAIGDTVVLFDSSGDEAVHVAVTTVNDPDEDVDDGQRGFHWVGVEVVFENVGEKAYQPNAYGIQLIDGEGFSYTLGFASRSSEDYDARPDLSGNEIAPGDTDSGWLFFEVINGAEAAWVVLNDAYGTQQFAVLANLTGAVIEDGDAVPFFNSNAEEIGTITVDEIILGFEDVDSSVEPERGFTTVGVNVTIENTGEDAFEPNNYAFYVVDDLGFQYYPAYYFRDDAGLEAYPDLSVEPVEPGDSVSGIILFDVTSESTVNYVLYTPDYTQLYIIAQPGEGSVVTGDTVEPVVVPTSDDSTDDDTDDNANAGEETGECVGVTDWANATGENVSVLNELEALNGDSIEDIDPEDVRDAAEAFEDAAAAQEDVDVPAAAEPLNDAILDFLNAYADVYTDVADRLEAGDDPADIEADYENDESLSAVYETIFNEMTALSMACPASDVSNALGD